MAPTKVAGVAEMVVVVGVATRIQVLMVVGVGEVWKVM